MSKCKNCNLNDITKFESLLDKFSFTIQDLMLLTISLDLLKLYLYYTPICVQLKHLTSTYLRTIIIWVPTYIYFLRKPLVNLTWPKITRTILEFQKVLLQSISRKTLRKFSIWEIAGSLVVSLKLAAVGKTNSK